MRGQGRRDPQTPRRDSFIIPRREKSSSRPPPPSRWVSSRRIRPPFFARSSFANFPISNVKLAPSEAFAFSKKNASDAKTFVIRLFEPKPVARPRRRPNFSSIPTAGRRGRRSRRRSASRRRAKPVRRLPSRTIPKRSRKRPRRPRRSPRARRLSTVDPFSPPRRRSPRRFPRRPARRVPTRLRSATGRRTRPANRATRSISR